MALALVVQDDSPTRVDVFWAMYRAAASGMFVGEALLCGSRALVPLVVAEGYSGALGLYGVAAIQALRLAQLPMRFCS